MFLEDAATHFNPALGPAIDTNRRIEDHGFIRADSFVQMLQRILYFLTDS